LYKMNKRHRAIFSNALGKREGAGEGGKERGLIGADGMIRGEFGEALTGREVTDVLVAYMKQKGWECSWNKGCVSVCSTDHLFDLATSAWKRGGSVAHAPPIPLSSSSSSITPPLPPTDTVKEKEDENGGEETVEWGEEDEARFNEFDKIDDEDDEEEEGGGAGTAKGTGTSVGGVWMPSVANHGKVSMVGKISGKEGEKEGGKSNSWKPVSLSSASAIATARAKKKNMTSNKAGTPSVSASVSAPEVLSQQSSVSEPVIITKEAILKELIRNMASYHAIVQVVQGMHS
jgi:hypothetical protein